ncbi:MAG: hypothetical protein ABSA41_01715 [Terriglobia bacterium]|jgi:hypothetical protein
MAAESLRLLAEKNNGRIPLRQAEQLTMAMLSDVAQAMPEREAVYILAGALDSWDPDIAFKLRGFAEHMDAATQLGQEIHAAISAGVCRHDYE